MLCQISSGKNYMTDNFDPFNQEQVRCLQYDYLSSQCKCVAKCLKGELDPKQKLSMLTLSQHREHFFDNEFDYLEANCLRNLEITH